MLPPPLSFTLLGGVESLLSAKVADGMTGRKHRSNMELVAQGLANIASALFGGICVTGTIARTATNIRAGARSPMSGILHAVFLLLFMLVAAPLAGFIPLAALAGVLVVGVLEHGGEDRIRPPAARLARRGRAARHVWTDAVQRPDDRHRVGLRPGGTVRLVAARRNPQTHLGRVGAAVELR